MAKPSVICLTPVKNEAWILDRFLSCASLWADHIIIADQQSTDDSRAIAERFPKVRLIDNPSPSYDEGRRQKLLLEAARTIPGPRLIICLDADEFLTANTLDNAEWETVLKSPLGTVIAFRWANIAPDFQSCWFAGDGYSCSFGFMDDGSAHHGGQIHSTRIPYPRTARRLELISACVMHYQYTDWKRMESKHRWYQAWERLNNPHRHAVDVFRQYHHMYGVLDSRRRSIPPEWFARYLECGIDMTSVRAETIYLWDREVLDLLVKHGPHLFRRAAIWRVNWTEIAERLEMKVDAAAYRDPRSVHDRLVHRWLLASQPRENTLPVMAADAALRRLGW